MPVRLAAEELDLVHALALPLAPDRRAAFVAAVAEQLEAAPALGPGVVFRTAAEIQPAYFSPIADPRVGQAQSRRA
jgi:hypothetical protein